MTRQPETCFRRRLGLLVATLACLVPTLEAHAPHDLAHRLALSPDFANDGVVFAYLELSDRPLFGRSSDAGRSWQVYGAPMTLSGVSGFAFSPDFAIDRTCFASTLRGGVWRTTDGGTTWQPQLTGLTDVFTKGVTVSSGYAVDGTVLVATPSGCFRSSDGGDSWVLSNTGLMDINLTSIAFAPGTPGLAFAGSTALHRSEDGGQTWLPVSAHPFPITPLALSPAFDLDGTLALGYGRNGLGVQVSNDSGASFTPMVVGLLTDLRINDLAIAPEGTFFAVTPENGVFRASGPGAAWTLLDDGLLPKAGQTDDHYFTLGVSPAFATDQRVFVGAWEGMFRSDEAGMRWRQLDIYPLKVTRAVRPVPSFSSDGAVYVGSYGGGPMLYTGHKGPARVGGLAPGAGDAAGGAGSAAGGSTLGPAGGVGSAAPPGASTGTPVRRWEILGRDVRLPFSTTLTLAPDFQQSGTMFYSYERLFRSDDRGHSWAEVVTPPEMPILRAIAVTPDWPADATMFVGSNQSGETYRSLDAGATWQVIPGMPAGHSTRHIGVSPGWTSDGTVFLVTMAEGVFRSTDGGVTFSSVSIGLPMPTAIRSFGMSPGFVSDGTLLVGSREDGLYRSTDRGESWLQVTGGLPAAEYLSVEDVAFSPAYVIDPTIFVSTLSHGVWRSTDGGDSWAPIGGAGLPLASTRRLGLSPDFHTDRTLFLSTQDWLWKSTDAGATFEAMPGRLRVDDVHHSIEYTGDWTFVVADPAFGLTEVESSEVAAYYELEFRGNEVGCYGTRHPAAGLVEILVDGRVVDTVDLYSPVVDPGVRFFSTSFAAVGWHKLRVRITGSSNPFSAGTVLRADGFDYSF